MYQAHWGLQESPFRGLLDPKFFYQSPTHEEALARLQFLVDQRRRLGLLVGPPGSGKSLLLEVFAEQLRRTARPVAKLSLLGVEPAEMLWLLAAGWGLSLDPTQSLAALWRAVTDRLIEYRYQQLEAVVLLDDADQADRQVLQHVTRLARFDPSPEMRLTIVLAGRNEGMAKLGAPLLDWPNCGSTSSRGSRPIRRTSSPRCWPKPGGSRPYSPSRPLPDCTNCPTAFPAASRNWPTWPCWPGPAGTPADRRRSGRFGLPRVGHVSVLTDLQRWDKRRLCFSITP